MNFALLETLNSRTHRMSASHARANTPPSGLGDFGQIEIVNDTR